MSDDWEYTQVRLEWCDEPANAEATPHGYHLIWINFSSYRGTISALMTIKRERRYYKKISPRVGTRSGTRTMLHEPVHGMRLICARWLPLTMERTSELLVIQ